MKDQERATIKQLLVEFRKGHLVKMSDAECIGLAVADYLGWDGVEILKASGYALEDICLHTYSAAVREMAATLEAWEKNTLDIH